MAAILGLVCGRDCGLWLRFGIFLGLVIGCWLGLLCMFSFSVFWSCACVRLFGVMWCHRFIFADAFRWGLHCVYINLSEVRLELVLRGRDLDYIALCYSYLWIKY